MIYVAGIAHPFEDDLAYSVEVEADSFDHAVLVTKEAWATLCAAYEQNEGSKKVPPIEILTVYRKDPTPRKLVILGDVRLQDMSFNPE